MTCLRTRIQVSYPPRQLFLLPMTTTAFSGSLHCLPPETAVALDGVWCESLKGASQVTSSPPDFINPTPKLFLLSCSKLQCSSLPESLPGPTLGSDILPCPRMELLVPSQLGTESHIRQGLPRMRISLLHPQTKRKGRAVFCIRQGFPSMRTRLLLPKFRILRVEIISI